MILDDDEGDDGSDTASRGAESAAHAERPLRQDLALTAKDTRRRRLSPLHRTGRQGSSSSRQRGIHSQFDSLLMRHSFVCRGRLPRKTADVLQSHLVM